MSIIEKLTNKIIYALTDKPEHYVHVDKPKTLQDRRQKQYNNWCKRHGVYCGSYLPENPDTLTKKGKGWVETKGKADKTIRNFRRKSTGQMVRYDEEHINERGELEKNHYHWKNGKTDKEHHKIPDEIKMINRYGATCKKHSPESHLAPLDKDFNKR